MRLPSALAPVILLAATSSYAADNVILVTLDGVRIQELFSGFDPELFDRADESGIYDPELDPEAGPPIEVAFRDSEVLTK